MNSIELGLVNKFIDVFVDMAKAQERQADALESMAKSNARLVELQEIVMKDQYQEFVDEVSGN